jgi:hypothetical protein
LIQAGHNFIDTGQKIASRSLLARKALFIICGHIPAATQQKWANKT